MNLCSPFTCLVCSSIQAYKGLPDDPYVNLFISLACLHWAMKTKHMNDPRAPLFLRALAFAFNYYSLSSASPEAAYNLGRWFHYIGQLPLAILYYNKVLEAWVVSNKRRNRPNRNDDLVENRRLLDSQPSLHREAAHNLASIYIYSGSNDLARTIYEEYVVF